jgi:hypothetical protein
MAALTATSVSAGSAPRQAVTTRITTDDGDFNLMFSRYFTEPKNFPAFRNAFHNTLSTVKGLEKALKDPKHKHSAVVRMWLMALVAPHLIDCFADSCPTAADLMKKLDALYGATAAGAADIHFEQLTTLQKRENEGMVALYARYSELVSYLKAADQKPSDKQLLTFFSKALPPVYKTHLKILMARDPPPATVEDILTSLVREENQLMQDNMISDPSGKALYTGGYKQQQRESPDSGDDSPYRGKNTFNGTCNYCKETGHIKRDCPKLANKNKSNQNKDIQKQLDEIQSRLHAMPSVGCNPVALFGLLPFVV